MSAKRFYERVDVVAADGGFTVTLDDRPIRTPGGRAFVAPRLVAEAAAEEWRAQGAKIDPTAMPITRAINSAIERIAPRREAVVDEIAAYAATDLVCHRADAPAALIEREATAWDPLLAWAEAALGAPLVVVVGVLPADQPEASRARLRARGAAETDLGLAALYALTTLSGSLVIALAVVDGRIAADEGWAASRVDEDFQAELWGVDAEAAAAAERARRDFLAAARLARLLERAL